MFEFNIDKHEPKAIYNRNGVECYLCSVRKKLIKITQEERVRQSLINYLVDELQFPIERIEIEKPLSHYKKGEKGRVDLIVLDNEGSPLILIECKEPNEIFGDHVMNQLRRYNDVIESLNWMVVVGGSIKLLSWSIEKQDIMELTSMPNYSTFLFGGEIDIEIEEEEEDFDIAISEPFGEELVNRLIEYGRIGKGTDRKLYPLIFNLFGFLFAKEELSSDQITDIGTRFTKFGNAGGGSMPGEYRAYIFKRGDDNIIVSFGIFGTYNTDIPDHQGATHLIVGVDFEEKSHPSLELRLDKYADIKDGTATLWHDGTITVGKLGMSKRQDVIDFIFERAPHLIVNNKIHLGTLDLTQRITNKQEETICFIKRTIEYALVRDEYRKEKKKQLSKSLPLIKKSKL